MPRSTTRSVSRSISSAWAIIGFSALLLWAIARLGMVALDALQSPLQATHWVLLLGNVVFMAWSEGYRGFQRGYAPRFADRVLRLREQGSALERLLAPVYAMGYFAAERRRLIVTYLLTGTIVGLIVLFHHIPQPWRGVLDAGVVVGLSWGLVACWWQCYHVLTRTNTTSDPVPDSNPRPKLNEA